MSLGDQVKRGFSALARSRDVARTAVRRVAADGLVSTASSPDTATTSSGDAGERAPRPFVDVVPRHESWRAVAPMPLAVHRSPTVSTSLEPRLPTRRPMTAHQPQGRTPDTAQSVVGAPGVRRSFASRVHRAPSIIATDEASPLRPSQTLKSASSPSASAPITRPESRPSETTMGGSAARPVPAARSAASPSAPVIQRHVDSGEPSRSASASAPTDPSPVGPVAARLPDSVLPTAHPNAVSDGSVAVHRTPAAPGADIPSTPSSSVSPAASGPLRPSWAISPVGSAESSTGGPRAQLLPTVSRSPISSNDTPFVPGPSGPVIAEHPASSAVGGPVVQRSADRTSTTSPRPNPTQMIGTPKRSSTPPPSVQRSSASSPSSAPYPAHGTIGPPGASEVSGALGSPVFRSPSADTATSSVAPPPPSTSSSSPPVASSSSSPTSSSGPFGSPRSAAGPASGPVTAEPSASSADRGSVVRRSPSSVPGLGAPRQTNARPEPPGTPSAQSASSPTVYRVPVESPSVDLAAPLQLVRDTNDQVTISRSVTDHSPPSSVSLTSASSGASQIASTPSSAMVAGPEPVVQRDSEDLGASADVAESATTASPSIAAANEEATDDEMHRMVERMYPLVSARLRRDLQREADRYGRRLGDG